MARETKSRWFEWAALAIMTVSGAVTAAIGALQVRHLLRREMKEEEREDRERDRRTAPASPPPEPPVHGGTATAANHGRDDDRRWTRREEQPHGSHDQAWQR